MGVSDKAVFLSYAREDAEAARRIADALRGFGVEVWFDQNELRGGDAWDAKIKKQIRECALFVAVISARTQARGEGYFRREWKLAVERTHDMAASRAFLVPVVIDDTVEAHAEVPDEFMRVQWTRLAQGVPTTQFVEQLKRLLDAPWKSTKTTPPLPAPAVEPAAAPAGRRRPVWGIGLAVLAGAAALIWWLPRRTGEAPPAVSPPVTAVASSPALPAAVDRRSIAVLPFANLSTEQENAFFADGVQDDVITNLAKIRALTVISRTSTLAYRDPGSRNLKKIAAELGVATVLEGSVARVGTKVHMNAQLIDARTDEHLWADTFDGDASDIFALQASLAQKIAAALKATLTAGEKQLIERRPTENRDAYELFQRARTLQQDIGEKGTIDDYEHILAIYEQATNLDPSFALAHAQAAVVHSILYWFGYLDPSPARAARMKVEVDAAVRTAPEAPETRLALGAYHYRVERDWRAALAEFETAEKGLPNESQLMFWLALTHRRLGEWTTALDYFVRATALNPRDLAVVANHVGFLNALRRYEQSRALSGRFLEMFPGNRDFLEAQAIAEFALTGDREPYARALEQLPLGSGFAEKLGDQVEAAFVRGDPAAVEQLLAAPPATTVSERTSSVIRDPWALARARAAFLRGEAAAARRFADEAAAYYNANSWNERQRPWMTMRLAQLAAWSGRPEEARRHAEAAMADVAAHDAYDAGFLRSFHAGVMVIIGRDDDALESLRGMFAGPSFASPNSVRNDPIWSRLTHDPRFQQILQAARPL